VTDAHPAQKAVLSFWDARDAAAARQAASGRTDAGRRGAVTAGNHLTGLEEIVCKEFVDAGFDPSSIRRKTGIELPGFYRPAKKWDVVVLEAGLLVAAIEFKSQVGPSFGNNFNNRTEEAIGSAVDVWRAYEAGRFGSTRPWLGYFFILEDAPESTRPVSLPSTIFPVDPVFDGSSYRDRYLVLCQRLIRERLYDAACFLTATAGPQSTIYEPAEELSFAAFASKIAGRATEIKSLLDTRAIVPDRTRNDGYGE